MLSAILIIIQCITLQRSDIDVMEARYFESNSQGLINDLRNELHILRDRERVLLQTITSVFFYYQNREISFFFHVIL